MKRSGSRTMTRRQFFSTSVQVAAGLTLPQRLGLRLSLRYQASGPAEIDLSGRIEETTKPTALALGSAASASLLIPAGEKQAVIDALRQQKPKGARTLIHVLIYSSVVFLLLKDQIEQLESVMIDPEYPGYEGLIKNRLLTLATQQGVYVSAGQISFGRIQRQSPTRDLAYLTFKGKVAPTRTLTAADILALFAQ